MHIKIKEHRITIWWERPFKFRHEWHPLDQTCEDIYYFGWLRISYINW